MKEIKRIQLMSITKIAFCVFLLLGICTAILYLISATLNPNEITEPGNTLGFDLAIVIGIPFIYGIVGSIVGTLVGFFYNLTAKFLGGIKVELE